MKNTTENTLFYSFTHIHPLIRWRYIVYVPEGNQDAVTDYQFEVFYRRWGRWPRLSAFCPYFWGLLGKKRWEWEITTNSFAEGMEFCEHRIKHDLIDYNRKNPKVDIFSKAYLDSLGYKVTEDDGQCGKAISKIPKGKRCLSWNRDKHATYFGIREDGDTRNVFNGIIETREQLELLLRLVR